MKSPVLICPRSQLQLGAGPVAHPEAVTGLSQHLVSHCRADHADHHEGVRNRLQPEWRDLEVSAGTTVLERSLGQMPQIALGSRAHTDSVVAPDAVLNSCR